jgi:SAM-dependent methyltransferase
MEQREISPAPVPLPSLIPLLACPACRAELTLDGEQMICQGCRQPYEVLQGIPLFAGAGSASAWKPQADGETSEAYQQGFMAIEGARRYRRLYEGRLSKRLTTRRELSVLARILTRLGRTSVLLDLPSGNGRVSEPLAASTDLLIEADMGRGQVVLGRQLAEWTTPTTWMTASAFQIPLRDGAVEGVVCNRLIHHLPSVEERERLLRELLRVSRRFVVMTFFDYYSLKNLTRLAKSIFGGKRHRVAVSAGDIARLAAGHGARLACSPRLYPVGSGQRYAVLIKGEQGNGR